MPQAAYADLLAAACGAQAYRKAALPRWIGR